jgi:hypothetical protein
MLALNDELKAPTSVAADGAPVFLAAVFLVPPLLLAAFLAPPFLMSGALSTDGLSGGGKSKGSDRSVEWLEGSYSFSTCDHDEAPASPPSPSLLLSLLCDEPFEERSPAEWEDSALSDITAAGHPPFWSLEPLEPLKLRRRSAMLPMRLLVLLDRLLVLMLRP